MSVLQVTARLIGLLVPWLVLAVPETRVHAQTPASERRPELPGPDARVPLITPAELARRMAGAKRLLLVDSREAVEFDVSHIKGAVRYYSEAEQAALVAQIRSNGKGGAIVVYCTGGVRSLQLAEGLYLELMEAGAASVHVLHGGIIAWANENRPLVDAKGATRDVHPWNGEMARGLKEPTRARYGPRS